MSSHDIAMHGDVAVIDCSGRIVAGELEELQTSARAAINQAGRVILNFRSVEFIDSTGLGMLAVLCLSARKQQGDVKLVAPSPAIQEILEITMLGRIFDVFRTVDEALAAFSKQDAAKSRG